MLHPEQHNLLLSFIFLVIIASLTAYYAHQKGRNPMFWFVMGLLISIFAPLILFFLPPALNEEDKSLPPAPKPSLAAYEAEKYHEEEDRLWYYLDQDHQQMGPVSVVALRELWNRGKLELNQYVWSEGMETWKRVDELPELKKVLSKPNF